jgi:hypothetical protein
MDLLIEEISHLVTAPGGLEVVDQTEEHLIGPLFGHHLACYTVRSGGAYFAYAKVCMDRPLCVWASDPIQKLSSGPFPESETALQAVIAKGTEKLARPRSDRIRQLQMLLRR